MIEYLATTGQANS